MTLALMELEVQHKRPALPAAAFAHPAGRWTPQKSTVTPITPRGLSSGGAPVSLPTITLPIVPLFPVPVPTLSPFSTLLPKCKSDDGLILY